MKTVHLARGLSFPAAELATKVTGAFGIRGCGKTSLMDLVCEQLLDAHIQVIILDPVGVHFAIRLAESGKGPSPYKIPVLGGRHGDLALAPTTGEVVGAALARSSDSCVLDISSMKKGERVRFAAAFFEAFYEGKKENPAPVLLCLEEAQRFAPQIMFKGSGQEQMLGAIEELAEQGRNFGAGLWLNTLRPQKVNKDVTSLMDLVFGFRLTGVHERKAVKEWLQEKGAEGREEIDGELPSLQAGHAFVWSPAVFNVFGKYHMNRKTTYDAGATPLYARAKVKMKPLDLDELQTAMTAVVEEAKANDPRALKARIAELEREREKLGATPLVTVKTKTVEVPMLGKRDLKRIERLTTSIRDLNEQLDRNQRVETGVRAETDTLVKALQSLVHESALSPESRRLLHDGIADAKAGHVSPVPALAFEDMRPRQVRAVDREPVIKHPPLLNGPTDLSRCARALLRVLAVRGNASDSQISALSGYKKTSSSFANGLSELRTRGFIDGTPDNRVITAQGKETAGPQEPLPTGAALVPYWRSRLTKSEATMLEVIYKFGTISREDLAREAEYSITSSSFANALSGLRTLDLIHGRPGGDVTIADVFRE